MRLAVCLLLVTLLSATSFGAPDRPNIVILLIDDLGSQDLGCYGNTSIDTPRIDALAADGRRWTQAYSACPVCSPSRVAILTGRNPARVHFTGHITAIDRHRHPAGSRILPPDDLMDLPHSEVTLAEALRPAGYQSIHLGKWHVGHEGFFPEDQGFDINIGGNQHGAPKTHWWPYRRGEQEVPLDGGQEGEYLANRLTNEAIAFLENRDSNAPPFLMYFAHYAVHTPLEAPPELVAKYKTRLANDSRIDPTYAAMVDNMDINVGRVLDTLDSLRLTDDTLVILTSDNGAVGRTSDNRPFREGKGHLYEGGLRIPLMMRWPDRIEAGSVSRTPTISEDLYATLVDLIPDTQPGANLDGRSLAGDLWGNTPLEPADLHWYYPHYAPQRNRPGQVIRSGSLKLIQFLDPYEAELYDLTTDPGETNNLALRQPEKVAHLQRELEVWLESVEPIRHTPNPGWKP